MSAAVNQIAARAVDGCRARLGAWLRNDARRWSWSGPCLVCREAGLSEAGLSEVCSARGKAPGAALSGRDLCAACARALPRMTTACLRCGVPLPEAGVCGQCRSRPPPLREVHAACRYDWPVDRLLPRFKFHGDLAAGRLLAQLMAEAFGGLPPPEALVPVPLHVGRLRGRGYDQALVLARPLSRALGIRLQPGLLVRTRATAPQSEHHALARRRNVRRAFGVRAGAQVPAHVVLVDDVMTTGATLHAAAEALLRSGVRRVDAWVCARVP